MEETTVERPEEKIWTYEDYMSGRIPAEVSEIVKGKGVRKMPVEFVHGLLEGKVSFLLLSLTEQKYFVAVGGVGLLISRSPLTLRGADVVAISKDRIRIVPEGAIEVPPDLIVEIVSHTDSLPYILGKMEDYRRWGVRRQVWVFPEDRKVVVVAEEGLKVLGEDEEVELLEGVRFRLKDLLKEVEDEGSDS